MQDHPATTSETSVLDQTLDPGGRQQAFVDPEHNHKVG